MALLLASRRLPSRSRAPLALAFQNAIAKDASQDDREASDVVKLCRKADSKKYDAPQRALDHFSRNVDVINSTELIKLASAAPKAAHLHIHFNSTLPPEFLLGVAKEMPNMYISSATHKLRSKDDFDNCEVVFNLHDAKTQPQDHDREDPKGPNLFRDDYTPGQRMRYQYFRAAWVAERKLRQEANSSNLWAMDVDCDQWLASKLIFNKHEIDQLFSQPADPAPKGPTPETEEERVARQKKAEEAGWDKDIEVDFHNSKYKNIRLRATRAWDKFNGRTRMMKGLFNYEKAFRAYTRKCLEEFVADNVQYAEIRPNFMKTNQVLRDDGSASADNFAVMRMIIEEYENFMKDIGDMNENGDLKENRLLDSQGKPIYVDGTDIPRGNGFKPSFGGMKVIYCTPRSFDKGRVKDALQECKKMKELWPQYIAGFDLVGEESYSKPYPLKYFEEEFRQFQAECPDIPFLFHCGETPDDIEGNLDCALRLNSKRIGHGYALPKKPDLMRQMKEKDVCVEACPISNMVLGLTERMNEHSIYELLAHEVHCTLNSDNGTLFRSKLSHDFYEVMVGNEEMNLFGWKQLARWSIDHSCMSQDERERVLVEWERRWTEEFIPTVLKKHGKPPARFQPLNGICENERKRLAQLTLEA
ncbi:Metallo-dependent hydrolase [Durotheca rogersii]|uniref:Metallo-dependent hydrolase n=1 Tax=Durotheca rogersii TaxID=419775 RepID=UPI00221EBDE9|nr:Metallo-dependent hydrolase [Durotheca rogersii]KAI5865970.1 Metallo-dependent hydrolase [Durotheca rogersii]